MRKGTAKHPLLCKENRLFFAKRRALWEEKQVFFTKHSKPGCGIVGIPVIVAELAAQDLFDRKGTAKPPESCEKKLFCHYIPWFTNLKSWREISATATGALEMIPLLTAGN
ncbi:hypothetical protein [Hymenobacter volaticus]|uniref:Uncharacterized protein n=1 Tax=Hymenobacter volaticus TaxID=2932254 RepID=A0ABY4GE86_9BACT|nr:hypothetical protein [Hymenobacter volaticus]UOQ69231.1 hypothetical protein MUN86_27650 [Hymenobacter volaticus]